jgi:fluoride exporter
MTNRIILLIGIGGFIGSVARYYSQQIVSKIFPSPLPYGTLSVNVLGCLIIGLVYGLSEKGNVLSPEWRLFLATGLCGGFTTFSTFSYENIQLLRDGEFLYASAYIVLSVVLCLFSTYGGFLVTKFI